MQNILVVARCHVFNGLKLYNPITLRNVRLTRKIQYSDKHRKISNLTKSKTEQKAYRNFSRGAIFVLKKIWRTRQFNKIESWQKDCFSGHGAKNIRRGSLPISLLFYSNFVTTNKCRLTSKSQQIMFSIFMV